MDLTLTLFLLLRNGTFFPKLSEKQFFPRSFFSPIRYVRICYLCQLRQSSTVTEDNVWKYQLAAVVFPVLFYLPKWFEVRWQDTEARYNVTVDCEAAVMDGSAANATFVTRFFEVYNDYEDGLKAAGKNGRCVKSIGCGSNH